MCHCSTVAHIVMEKVATCTHNIQKQQTTDKGGLMNVLGCERTFLYPNLTCCYIRHLGSPLHPDERESLGTRLLIVSSKIYSVVLIRSDSVGIDSPVASAQTHSDVVIFDGRILNDGSYGS